MQRLYVLVRRDLPPSHQAVQAGHAVASWCLDTGSSWNNEVLVYLHVRDEPELLDVASRLEEAGACVRVFREPDRKDQATALAVSDSRVRSILKRLPLLELGA
jgi:hypothetical protein